MTGTRDRTRARTPGVERLEPLARRCLYAHRSPTQSGEYSIVAESTKGDGKPGTGKAASDIPGLEAGLRKTHPCGILERASGNRGIIRSPQSAIVLPDNFRGGNGNVRTNSKPGATQLPCPTILVKRYTRQNGLACY